MLHQNQASPLASPPIIVQDKHGLFGKHKYPWHKKRTERRMLIDGCKGFGCY